MADEPSKTHWIPEVWNILRSKTSIRPMLGIVIVLGFLVFAPHSLLEKWKLDTFITGYWPWILIVFGLSSAMLLIHGVEAAVTPLWKRTLQRCKIKTQMLNLLNDEKNILSAFCAHNQANSTVAFYEYQDGVGSLEKNGLIVRGTNIYGQKYSFTLSPALRTYIFKHRKEVSIRLANRFPPTASNT